MTAAKKYPRSTRRKDALHLVARQYPSANLRMPNAYWDDSLPASCVAWGSQEDYEVIRQVGKGKYGEVYESTDLRTRQKCVIKIMRPVKEHRLRREIKILRHVRGGPNVVELREVLRDADTKTPCFVFELVDAIGFRELQAAVTDLDVRNYIFQLLRALDFCHSKGIMHRDVKPGNVLIDHNKKELKLIDWGLADFYHPGKEYPVRVATRFYKGPELLVDIRDYDYSLDVWGVGCMLAALVFKRPVFFRGDDEFDQLVKIARVLGSDGLHRYCDKYGVELDSRLDQLVGLRPAVPWRKFSNADNAHLCSPEAYDLLGRLLMYDHHERLTCAEAMGHAYFAPIRAAAAAQAAAQAPASVPGPSGMQINTMQPVQPHAASAMQLSQPSSSVHLGQASSSMQTSPQAGSGMQQGSMLQEAGQQLGTGMQGGSWQAAAGNNGAQNGMWQGMVGGDWSQPAAWQPIQGVDGGQGNGSWQGMLSADGGNHNGSWQGMMLQGAGMNGGNMQGMSGGLQGMQSINGAMQNDMQSGMQQGGMQVANGVVQNVCWQPGMMGDVQGSGLQGTCWPSNVQGNGMQAMACWPMGASAGTSSSNGSMQLGYWPAPAGMAMQGGGWAGGGGAHTGSLSSPGGPGDWQAAVAVDAAAVEVASGGSGASGAIDARGGSAPPQGVPCHGVPSEAGPAQLLQLSAVPRDAAGQAVRVPLAIAIA